MQHSLLFLTRCWVRPLGLLLLLGSSLLAQAQAIRYVKPMASGTGDGSSWTNASGNLQAIINASAATNQVWVAAGLYKPTTTTDRTISFALKAGVAVYGGFVGGESSLSQRPVINPVSSQPSSTTLSGDIGLPGDKADNSYHVINNPSGLTSTTRLDGFVITGGNANASSNVFGGGMYNSSSNPSVTNCSFIANSATYGGGMANRSSSSPSVTNCSFQANSATAQGGGMSNSFSNPSVTNCSFIANSSAVYGGGMANSLSNPSVTNCSFQANSATTYGGGMSNDSSSPSVTNCSFQTNSATNGGGMSNDSSSPSVTNCSFIANTATNGGGMQNLSSSNSRVTNCSFQANSASSGGGMANRSSSPRVTNCSFQTNSATNGGGMDNLGSSSSPSVTNCVFFNNGGSKTIYNVGSSVSASYSLFDAAVTGYANGAGNRTTTTSPFASSTTTQLSACSPAIDAGTNSASALVGITTDLAGNPRFFNNGTVDMGAYELQATASTPLALISQPPAGSAVCPGGSVTVSVSTTGTVTGYQWYKDGQVLSPAQPTASLSLTGVQPTDAGSYALVVTGACNSVTSTAFSLTVNAPPVATLTATPSIVLSCAQTSLTLTAGGGTTYAFSGPGVLGQSGNQATVNAPGTYSVSVTNAGCTRTTSITINQDNAAPVASLVSSGTLTCAVTSVTLTASPNGLSYRFSGGASQISTSNQALVSTSGSYSVTVLSGNGCSAVASTSVSQDNTAPTATIVYAGSPFLTTSGPVSVSLTGTTGGTYSSSPAGLSLNTGTGQITPASSTPASYTVTYTIAANGDCAAFSTTVAVAIQQPQADLSITITDGVTTSVPGGSVTYTITVSNTGPQAVTGVQVSDMFPPSLTPTWTATGFGGGTVTPSGSGNINQLVNLPTGGGVIFTVSASVSSAATGTLTNTATVTAPGGVTDPTPGNNSATDTNTLTPQADLSITVTDGVNTAQAGGSVTYTLTVSNAGPSNATGATVVDTFPAVLTGVSWTVAGAGGGSVGSPAGTGNINQPVNLPSGGSVTFTVTATLSSSAMGTLSNTATVTAPGGVTDPTPGNNSATDTDSVTPATATITGFAAMPNPVCAGDVTTFTATVGNVTLPYGFTLSGGSGTVTGTAASTAFTQSVAALNPGIQPFTLTVQGGGPSSSATTSVTVTPQPTASILTPGSTTLTCASPSLSLTATGGGTYRWEDTSTNPIRMVNASGPYSVTVVSANGCSAVASVSVSQDNAAPVSSLVSSGSLTCSVTSVTLTASPNGLSYLFSAGATQLGRSNQALVNASGPYSVTVVSGNNGCSAVASTSVSQDNTAPLASLVSSGTLTCAVTSVTLTASPNGLSYVFSAGASQIGTSNQAVVSASGPYSVTVVSGNNGCSAVAQMVVTSSTVVVSVTNPSVTTATQGVAFSQAFTVASGFSLYNYSLVSGRVPSGLSLSTTGLLAGTPTQVGSFTLTVGATDANGCSGVSAAYVLSVSEPVFVGTLRLIAPTYNCTTGAIIFRTVGGDGSGVEYRAIGVTDWTTNPNQVVDLPVRQDANAQPLLLQARQGGVMVTYTFDFRLYCNSTVPNQPPVFTQPQTQTATVGQPFSYRLPDNTFRDLNGTAVNFMAMNLPAGLNYAPDTRIISGVPTAVGSYSVTLSVSDPLSQSASGVLVIQVNPVAQPPVSTTMNVAPVFNGPLAAQSGMVGSSFTYTLPVGVFTDPTGDVLTYQAQGVPAGLQFTASSQTISGQPTTAGTYSVSLTATDGGGLSASGLLTITISTSATPPPPGAQPLAVIQPLYNCQTGAITFRTTGGDGSAIYFTSVGIVGYSTQTSYVVEAPIRNDANSQPLLIKATQSGVTTSYLFDFRVYCNGTVATNPPVFTGPLPTQTGQVGVSLSYQLPPNSFTALNGGTLNYGVTGLPAGLSFTAGTKVISGVPTQAGSVTALITATDPLNQSGQGSLVFVISPAPVQPPVVGQPLSLVAPLYDCGTGAFTFQTTGGNGSAIEYFAVGITGPSTVAGPYIVRPAGDAQPFTLKARQSEVEVIYIWDFKAVCSSSTRVGVAEVANSWTLRSIGNPVTRELVVEVLGAMGESIQFELTDLNGQVVESRLIIPTSVQHREVFEVSRQGAGVLLLQAQSSTRRQTLKGIKQ